ncbi:MAG TPA: uracil-DNA glycosylase [Blastocatellia bacterium]|nr:uracil-DNA glycosylase [Blastocatellia bacterium]
MNPREEIRELIVQAKEHLRYYSELGLTHIGAISVPGAPEPKRPEPSAPAIITQAPLAPEPKITMPTNPENAAAGSLFGAPPLFDETSRESAETQYANETLEDIRRDLGDCKRCKLFSTRTNIVFGEGSPKAELMFVGEGPGADEDATGRPFVGRAGQLLTKMIEAIDLKREDVYIANVVKSRPPGNRTPESDEVKACIPFLFRQIAAIRPKLIVALGNPAMQALLDTKIGITKMRGNFQDYPRIPEIKVLPTFHPAYLLRSPDKKREAWEDLKKVRAFLRGEL